jgi:hypothetical protein
MLNCTYLTPSQPTYLGEPKDWIQVYNKKGVFKIII